MSNQEEKNINDDDFIKNLDNSSPLSDGADDDDDIDENDEDKDEEDEDFKESLDTEFPLSGGETEL